MKAPSIFMVISQKLPHKHRHLQLFLFGHLHMEQDGQPLAKALGQKVAALLAYLACNPGPHARAQLAELFWADIPPERFLPNLRSTLNRLPKVFKQYIKTTQQMVAFEPADDVWIDVLAFQNLAECLPKSALITSNQPSPHLDQIIQQLQAIQDLYKGAFLAELTLEDAPGFTQWQVTQRSLLARLAADGLRQLAHLSMHRGRYAESMVYAQRMLELDPQDKAARRLLQLLSARCGKAQSPQHEYSLPKTFHTELPPGPYAVQRGKNFSDDLAQPLAQEFNPPSTMTPPAATEHAQQPIPMPENADPLPPTSLPILAEPFIGRQREVAELMHTVRTPNCRLLTITGLGGMGKTYLAVEAARKLESARDFIHGVYFVPLEGVQSGERVPEAILQALKVVLPGQDDLLAALCNYLATKEMLFIFDNFEHLVASSDAQQQDRLGEPTPLHVGRKILAQLLQAAPNIKFVVTSRQPLQLQQEHLFPVAGLHCLPPDQQHPRAALAQNDAIRLFLQVAARVNQAFQLTEANKQVLLQFCQAVQGVPLAIVLGAAQMDCLTPQQLVKTYQENIDILEIDWVDLPERQQSIRALFDYSWQRLDPALRQVFAQLTIFQGGFTRRAAQQIVGASLLQLRQLYHQSLLQQSAQGRYQIHELLRQLGTEKLTALKNQSQLVTQFAQGPSATKQVAAQPRPTVPAAVRDRHMHFYLTWLAQQIEALQGRQQQAAVADILLEQNNLRQAWQHAVTTRHVAMLANSVESYHLFYEVQGLYQERLAVVTDAIQALEPTIRQRYSSHGIEDREDVAGVTHKNGQNATASDALDLKAYCFLLASQGDCFIAMGNSQRAIHNAQRLIAYTKLLGEHSLRMDFLQAWGYRIWSRGLSMLGEDRAANALADQAIAAAQCAAHPIALADGFHMRGNTRLLLAQMAGAEADFQQAYALYVRMQNPYKAMNSLERLGSLKVWTADLRAAQRYYEQAIEISTEIHDQPSRHRLHFNLSRVTYKLGAYRDAESKTEAALHFFEEIGDRWLATEAHYFLGKLYCSAGQYTQAQQHQTQALEISRSMNARRNQIICLTRLGITLKYLGRYQQALAFMQEAEAIAGELKTDPVRSHILICIADTFHDAGQTIKSIALYKEALSLYASAELGYQKVEAITGLANALCQAGDSTAALLQLEEVAASLEINLQELHTLAEPFATYLNYYRVLKTCQDQRAPAILDRAYTLLQQWAKQIDDGQWRQSFLENVAVNREIVRLYKEESAGSGTKDLINHSWKTTND
ncbi:MAG: tetratricopeptide repeat protein [Caldilineaceae bacterium]